MGTGPKPVTHSRQIAIVGRGRLGIALAQRLTRAGYGVLGPLARGYDSGQLAGAEVVLLCVPDREIVAAAGTLAGQLDVGRCPLVGHCSGIATLDVLAPLPVSRRFSLHPLMTFSPAQEPRWQGAAGAVAATDPQTLQTARELAASLGLSPFSVADPDRGAYHAAASMASNFLITLELAAERLAASAGVDRTALLPLVLATVENWGREGATALTGPIARGDEITVTRQRAALIERTPELLELFDALAAATRALALDARSPVNAETDAHPHAKMVVAA